MERAAESANGVSSSSEYVDWINQGTSPAPAAAQPAAAPPSPRRRKSGSNRAGSAKDSSAKGDIGIPAAGEPGSPSGSVSERYTLAESLKQTADGAEPSTGDVLQNIADRFTKARNLNKAEAWRQLQLDLMNASPKICPLVLPYKDLVSLVKDIEDFMKGSTGSVGRSNEELLSEFLNGGGPLQIAAGDIASTLDDVEPLDDAITDINGPNDTNRE